MLSLGNVSFCPSALFLLQIDYASSVMERFGQRGFRDELDGPNIHRLSNILTLNANLHALFDKLALWLEADEVSGHERCDCNTHPVFYRRNKTPTVSARLSTSTSLRPLCSSLKIVAMNSPTLVTSSSMQPAAAVQICRVRPAV
jgi:HNH endonuclease